MLLVVAALVLVSGGCERADRRLGAVTRLNQVAGDVEAHSWPDYTDIVVRNGVVTATWMAPTGPSNSDIVVRTSTDSGATWQEEVRPNRPEFADTISVSPRVVRFPESDGLLLLWQSRRNLLGQKFVVARRSEDGGRTFGPFHALNSIPQAFLPVSATRGKGEVVVAWTDERRVSRDIIANRSTDGGRSWLAHDVLVTRNVEADGGEPTVALGPGGEAVLVWEERRSHRRGNARKPHLLGVYSTDVGASFSAPAPVEKEYPQKSPLWPRLAVSGDRYSLVWASAIAGASHQSWLYLSQSTDAGRSWTPATEIFRGEEAPFHRIQADGEQVYLVWHGGPRTDIGIYFQASDDGGASWRHPWAEVQRLDSSPQWDNAFRPALASDGSGAVVVAWVEAKRRVVLRWSRDYGRSWSEPLLIAEEVEGGTLHHPRLAVEDGRAHILWERWPDKSKHIKTLLDVDKPLPRDIFVRPVELD